MAQRLGVIEQATGNYAQTTAGPVHYLDIKRGPDKVLVLIHGGGPGASGWGYFRKNALELSKHFRLVIVDLPGYGKSEELTVKEPTTHYYATVVKEILSELHIGRPAHLMGSSMGGAVAFRCALEYPEVVDRMVLISPVGAAAPVFSTRSFVRQHEKALDDMRKEGSAESVRAYLSLAVHDPQLLGDDLVTEGVAALRADKEPWLLSLRPLQNATGESSFDAPGGTRSEDLWRECERIHQRTLLAWGRDDRITPVDGSLFLLKYMRDAQLHILPRCGHWAQLECSHEVERVAASFFNMP
jgi:pimeloyl-ACP methyl ester carboxylesterase